MSALLGIFRKLSIISALIVGWLVVLLLFVGWLIFAYDQTEALGFIGYVKSSFSVVSQPPDTLEVSSVLRLVFASIAAAFALIVSVITLPMFVFVYASVGYNKMLEKLRKPKEVEQPEADAAAP